MVRFRSCYAFEGSSAAMKCVDSWHVVFILYHVGVSAKFICFLPRHYGSRERSIYKRQGDFIGAIAVKANWPHDALFTGRVPRVYWLPSRNCSIRLPPRCRKSPDGTKFAQRRTINLRGEKLNKCFQEKMLIWDR